MKRLQAPVLGVLSLALLVACQPDATDKETQQTSPRAPTQDEPAVMTPLPPPSVPPWTVTMKPTEGHAVSGQLKVESIDGGVRISGHLSGLEAGSEHGFHIHETGDCSAADAGSAGSHFNPDGKEHGQPTSESAHAGDLPNQIADSNGEIEIDVTSSRLSLGSGEASDIGGRAVVLHAQPDDYQTQPSGASGDRIACGVIGG